MNINLNGVSETLLITLWAKAEESKREDSIIKDYKSIEISKEINYDFSKFKNSKGTQVGTCIRTKIIDDIIKDIIEKSSAESFTIINLGAGLDTRVSKFIKDNIYWYDIDFEDVILLRKQFFKELENNKNYECISSSILDYRWIKNIKVRGTVIIISEGVLMYIEENYIKELIEKLSENFINSHFIFDTIPTISAKNTKLHETVKETAAVFRWGLDIPSDIEKLSSHIRFINSYNYADYFKNRWGLMAILRHLPFVKNMINFNTIHIRLV
ncbi:class I SAM-dependent methyltransferase [Brachyspira intermedia]|uniref:class I SAM-dependent methyltransferase n=1 Tax=Brachyspira intermedia TaxID=84377 RepID=UPI00300739F8